MSNPCDFVTPTPCVVNSAFTYTRYPCDQDDPRPGDTRGLPVIIDLQTPVKAEIVNRHREAILAIEGELGTNPSGDYANLRDRLDQIQSALCTIWQGLDTIGIIISTGTFSVLDDGVFLEDGYGVKELNFIGSGITAVADVSFSTNGRVNITVPYQTLTQVLGAGNSSGGTNINLSGNTKVINSLNPTNPQDLTTKAYVDSKTTLLHQQRFMATVGQTVFTLSNTPASLQSTEFFVDGLAQSAGVDYSLLGNVVTYIGSTPFIGDEEIVIKYFESSAFITTSQGLPSVLGIYNGTDGYNINLGGNTKVINSLNPTSPQDVATKSYVDSKTTLFHQERFIATASQTVFTLSNIPASLQSTELFIDGLSQSAGVDYSLLVNVVTFIGSYTFTGGEEVVIKYFESSAFITVSQGLSSVLGVYNGTDGYNINLGGNTKVINSQDPTNAQDLATKIYVDRIVSVDTVALLRSTSSLTAFGFIHLECHTTKGWGGGDLYWDASSTEADNNGTIFQVTGVATGRWKRDISDAVDPCWFGAVGTYTIGATPDSTAAFQAALTWVKASVLDRSMKINQGKYLITDELDLTTNVSIIGSGHGTMLVFNSPGKSCFVIGRSAWAFNIKLKDFAIDGFAGCGKAAIEIVQSILSFDIDLVVRGGFDYGWYSHFTDGTNNGAAQWGSLKLTTLRGLAGPNPANYIYSDSYFNACELTFYAHGGTGTGLTLIAGLPAGGGTHYSRFRGDIEGYNKGFSFTGVAGASFTHFTSEANTVPDTMYGCYHVTMGVGGSSHPIELTSCHDITFNQWGGGITTSANCYHIIRNDSGGGPTQVTRLNASEISTYGGVAEFRGQVESVAGFGTNEPLNILLNGDFVRWEPAGIFSTFPSGASFYEGKFTKCGDGLADTTKTSYSPYSFKAESIDGYSYGWVLYWDVPMVIPQHLLNCDVTLSFKAKYVSGSTIHGNLGYTVSGQNDLQWTYVGGDMPCENGFRFHSMSVRISQDMVTYGLRLAIAGYHDAVFYISELSLSIGTIAPRTFNRCSTRIGLPGEMKPNGSLITYTSSIPVSANDPLFNRPWKDGDQALLYTPTFTNGIYQTGWIRYNSSWSPLANVVDLEWFGLKGDGVTDDVVALEAAIAAAPAGATIVGKTNKKCLITHGLTINKSLTLKDIYLYMPNPSTRNINVTGIATNYDAMLLCWNGATRSVTNHQMVRTAGVIDKLRIKNCTFEADGYLGSPLLTKSAAVALFGVADCIIEDCLFTHGSREQIVGDAFVDQTIIRRNRFINCNHDGISASLSNSQIYDNYFENCLAGFECGGYKVQIARNVIKTSTAVSGSAAIWFAVNSIDLYHDVEIVDNTISGPFVYPILTTDSGSSTGAALFKRQIIRRNNIICGSNSGVGTQIIWIQSSNGGVIECEDNFIDTTDITSNSGAVFRMEGTATASKVSIRRNKAYVPNSYVYTFLQCDTNVSPLDFDDNETNFDGYGSYRTTDTDATGKTYRGAAVFGSADAQIVRIRRNTIGSTIFQDTLAATTVIQAADHNIITSSSSAKSITQVYTSGTVSLQNTHATANKTLVNSGNLVTLTGVDTLILPGESAKLEATNLAGSAVRIISDSTSDTINKLWPLRDMPYGFWHADFRKTLSSSNLATWTSLVGSLVMVPGVGDATAPVLGTGWTGGRGTIVFNGVHDRIYSYPTDTRFNGNDIPISVIIAYLPDAAATTRSLFTVAQYGSSAECALRGDIPSATASNAIKVYGGNVISANRTGMVSGIKYAAYRLRADGYLAHDQGGTRTIIDANAATSLANQNTITLGDVTATSTGFPFKGEVRAMAVTSGLTDEQILSILHTWECYL